VPFMSPKMIQFDFMRRCQLQCRICKIWSHEPTKPEEELTYEEMCSLADQASEIGIKNFYISGGEPFLLPYLIQILEYAKKKGLRTEVATNGGLLNPERCRQVIGCGLDQIYISVDGAHAATHDYHRNKPGLFDQLMRSVRTLLALKEELKSLTPKIFICFVVTNKNFEEMLDFVRLAESLGTPAFFQPYVSENDRCFYRDDQPDEFSIPKDRLPLFCDEVDKVILYKNDKNKNGFVSNTVRSLEAVKDYFCGRLRPIDYCYAGFSRIHILKDHKVNLCPGDIGNFKDQSLKEILTSEKAKGMRHKTIHCTKPCFIAAAYYPGPSLSDIFLIVKKHVIGLQKDGRCGPEALLAIKECLSGYKAKLLDKTFSDEGDKIELIQDYLDSLKQPIAEVVSCRQ
jgi:MoaA/NifB/PqqE/SkfB family radical SAM enzyme